MCNPILGVYFGHGTWVGTEEMERLCDVSICTYSLSQTRLRSPYPRQACRDMDLLRPTYVVLKNKVSS
jgi:hypothetical protein